MVLLLHGDSVLISTCQEVLPEKLPIAELLCLPKCCRCSTGIRLRKGMRCAKQHGRNRREHEDWYLWELETQLNLVCFRVIRVEGERISKKVTGSTYRTCLPHHYLSLGMLSQYPTAIPQSISSHFKYHTASARTSSGQTPSLLLLKTTTNLPCRLPTTFEWRSLASKPP
jgi:hypothetical protein